MKLSRSIGVMLLLLAGSVIQLPGQIADTDRKEFEAIRARADKGDVEAQLSVASHYTSGEGVARDPARAAKYIRKAAEQGDHRPAGPGLSITGYRRRRLSLPASGRRQPHPQGRPNHWLRAAGAELHLRPLFPSPAFRRGQW